MLIGIWKSVAELEDTLSLPELMALLNSCREKEQRDREFFAAINGIDIKKAQQEDVQKRFDDVQRRVRAKLTGSDVKQLEFDDFGLELETEE